MDWEQWKEFMRKRMKHLESEEEGIDYLAKIYFLLNQWSVVQELMIMETKNSTVH